MSSEPNSPEPIALENQNASSIRPNQNIHEILSPARQTMGGLQPLVLSSARRYDPLEVDRLQQ
jgi:hypothetical protein